MLKHLKLGLYHYERKSGTTTFCTASWNPVGLYHYERKSGTTTVLSLMIWFRILYHYERKSGTTTLSPRRTADKGLYHYERKSGTTTFPVFLSLLLLLYHYERKLGTTTMRPHWGNKFPSYCNSCGGGELRTRGAHRAQKRKHRHSFEHGGKSLHRLHPKHHSALMFPFIIFYHRRATSRHPEVLIVDLTFSLLFSFFCLWRWRFMV